MFKTKRDVDRHVTQLLNKIRNEAERNARGFQFAKLYYDVGDFVSSKRYIQAYLSVREPVPQAHKLLGQVYEKQNDKEKALEAYKRSLDLEPEQKDLVLKVCELYGDTAVTVNSDVAQFWIDKAEKLYPGNYMIFKLKERMIDMNGTVDDGELEHLISAELMKNPGDVHLHIKLLNHFVQSGDVQRAYDHATSTEKTLAFVGSIAWYECISDIYQTYLGKKGSIDDYTFYTYKLFAVANLTYLRIQADDRDVLAATKALHQFDLDLYEAKGIQKQGSEWQSFLTEMTGQLFYLVALMLLKRALKGQVAWGMASSFGAICFLLSDSLPAIDLKSTWFQQVPKDRRKFYDRLHYSGYDRLSQGGHVIYSLLSKQNDSAWAKKLRQKLCTPNSRETLYKLVFTSGEMQRKKSQSYLLQSDVFTGTNLDVPSKSELSKYDSMAYILHCDNLRHLVWLAVQYHNLKEDVQKDYEQLFGAQLFPKMKFSVSDLSGGDPGSLCQLDVQVFFYLCVRWASFQQRDQRRSLHAIPDKPDILPVCLAHNMGWCTKAQADWWTAIYKMERNTAGEKLAKLYGVVMRGLETVRLAMPTALPLSLVVHVAKTLDARAKEIESLDAEGIVTPKLAGVQARAAYYWKAAEDYLHRMDRNQSIKQPKEMLFPLDVATEKEFTKDLRDQVKFAMAMIAMREERFEEALQVFENLYTPTASYYTGIIYRNLAETVDENGNSSGGSMMNNQQMAHLTRAKTALYTTLDRLETDHDEDLKESTRRDLDDVVCKLVSLESGGGMMDSILSAPNCTNGEIESESETEEPIKHPSPRTPVLPTPSRSRDFSTVSPTRLQVQLKALETTNTALSSRLSIMEEMYKTQEKLIQELFSQLREQREDMKSFRLQVLQDTMQNMSQMSLQARPSLPPQFPPTPQHQRSMMNAMNASMGGGAYDYSMAGGLPPHMSQYGAFPGPVTGSPRPGSAYGQPTLEDEFSHVDGEFYNPDGDEDYYIPDQNLIQEWPFGQKAGMEGKSTITYSPQHQARGINPANAGMFANVLRGQSIQYGGYQPQIPPQPAPPQLPGPGFFSQNSQQMLPPSVQSQAGKFMGQPQLGVPVKPGVPGPSPTLSPAMQPPRPNIVNQVPSASTKPATVAPMMPPNAVASNMAESKPTLNPGSVGVPPIPKKDVPGQTSSAAQLGHMGTTTTPSPGMSGAKPSLLPATSTLMSGMGLGQPGPASSILSQVAAKHQENTQQTSTAPAVPASTPQKNVFGGFTFTSTPKVTDTKKEEEKPKADVKVTSSTDAPKPFSGFSFTTPTQSPLAQKPSLTGTGQAASSPFNLGQNTASTFGSLTAGGQVASGFSSGAGDTKGFAGAGQTLFGKTPSPRRRNTSAGSDDHVDEYEPNVDFKPVVPLPDLVEVKTGEEDEEKVFGERAKLFRFHTDSNQWKERGIGEMKILKHKVTKVYRILMRREQVLKLCANHKLTKDLKLTPMSSSDKAWVWTAVDFSEGEMKPEKLAVKFKTQDQAERFKNALEDSQKEMESNEAARPKETDTKKKEDKVEKKSDGSVKKSEAVSSGKKSDLASLFKPKEGSWTCSGCYVKSDGNVLKCPCCNSLKPGVSKEDAAKAAPAAGFGSSATGGFSFGSKPASSTDTASAGGFKFGSSSGAVSSSNDDTKSNTGSAGGFKFGTPTTTAASTPATGGFSFGTPTTTAAASSTGSSGLAGFKFGSDTSAKTETVKSAEPNLPEPCKPTSGFTLAGKDGATSAGFNVNKDAPKYTFGEAAKETTSGEAKPASTEKPKIDLSESLLAKYLTGPDPAIEEVSSTTSEVKVDKTHDTKPSIFGASAIGAAGGFGKPVGTAASPFTFGSAVFGAAPEKTADKTAAANPFGTPSQSASEGFKFSMTPSKGPEKPQPAATLGGGFNFSMNLSPSKTSPVKPPTVKSPKSPEISEDGYYVNKEGDDSHIHFEPIINLPEKVEIKTGEEDEEVLYSHRAKLYRFTKGEWKERGLGDVKILFNTDSQKARILMRREQILKLCCNHYVTPDLKFRPMPNTDGNVLSWFAMDFSDGEPQSEQLSIKFKTKAIADSFQEAVELAKTKTSGGSDEGTVKVETIGAGADTSPAGSENNDEVVFVKEMKASPEQIAKARELQLPDHFYLYELAPECPGCKGCQSDDEEGSVGGKTVQQVTPYTVTEIGAVGQEEDDDDDYEDLDDEDDDDDDDDDDDTEEDDDDDDDDEGAEDDDEGDSDDTITQTAVSQLLAQLLSTEEQSTNTPQPGLPVFSGGFMQTKTAGQPSTEPSSSSSFVFGGSSSAGLSFSSLASASGSAFKTDDSKPFSWSGAGQKLFGAGGGGGDDGSGDEGDVQQGTEPHFEPIVPLPDLIDVKTGEEDETVEFAQRAKLFRFDTVKNEWKEKGIGEMKILKHPETGKYRFLLRREQVHKLACNHLLTPDLNLQPLSTSETSWCWLAQDYSDNEPKIEKLAVKFKTIDLAKTFKAKVDEVQQLLKEEES